MNDNYTPTAFPVLERGGNGLDLTDPGMDLRDYFAAKVTPFLLAQTTEFHDENWRLGVAWDAYKMADAMLIARGAREKGAA